MASTALSLKQRQYVEAVIAALPHLAEAVAAIPPECQVKAFAAAERSYLRTFRQLGLSGPETWASSVMRRLRRRVGEACLTESDKLKRLYEQLSANECLETAPGQRQSFDIPEQRNIGKEGKIVKLKLYRQLSNDEQIGRRAHGFYTHDTALLESDLGKLKPHEQLSADAQIEQEQDNAEGERDFDKLKLTAQLSADGAQAHCLALPGAGSSAGQDDVERAGESDKLTSDQQFSKVEQTAQAHGFELNDAVSSGEQTGVVIKGESDNLKDVGGEGELSKLQLYRRFSAGECLETVPRQMHNLTMPDKAGSSGEQQGAEGEGEFDRLKSHEQLAADGCLATVQRQALSTPDTAALGEAKNYPSKDSFDSPEFSELADEQIRKAHDICDPAPRREQKNVEREGARKDALAPRRAEFLIKVDEIFGDTGLAKKEKVSPRSRR